MTTRFCFTLDLVDNPEKIAEYEQHHENVWPEVRQSFEDAGILSMELYRWETRLFMIMDVDDTFSFERKAEIDRSNPVVQSWESLMSSYQVRLANSPEEGKWLLMKNIFGT